MFIERHVRVVDSGLEGDLWRFEGVVGGEDEEKGEFAALREKC